MLAIIGASGKLGFATLNALIDNNLIPPNQIICTTSSDRGVEKLSPLGVQIRRADWDSPIALQTALQDCTKLFLISSSRIAKDFFEAPPGEGREADHFAALEAARKAGVRHVYYTSLAFAKPSQSRVMKAHERTEEWLKENWSDGQWTVLREGLYNESWPLYLGHWKFPDDERSVVPVGGNGKVSWTSIADLGLASALVLAASGEEWKGKTVYLSQSKAYDLEEVAEMVSKASGRAIELKVVEREAHEQYYIHKRGMDEGYVKWWSKSYDALRDDECEVKDATLENLLAERAVEPKSLQETIDEMFAKARSG